MQWTEDQTRAIEIRDKNLLVSAAAGSGKTALLIERIRRIVVEEGVPVDRLLVLTFTRAAASEMKERLSRALMQELSSKDSDKAYLIRQINLMTAASISTLHAFCSTLVREYFQEAGIDPEFSLMNEAERQIVIQESLEEVFEAEYLKIPEDGENAFSRLVEMFSSNRSDEGLKSTVESLYTFLATQPEPDAWCEAALQNFDLDEQAFWQGPWGQIFKSEMTSELEGAAELLARALKLCEGVEGFGKTQEQLEEDLRGLDQIRGALASDNGRFKDMICGFEFPRYKGAKKIDEALSETIKGMRNEAKEILKKWRSLHIASIGEELDLSARMKAPMAELIRLTGAFKARFSEKKQAKNLLDFNDLEAYALKILNNPDIAGELRERYLYIFLDEYQDTNDMQETIIQRIVRKNNYFMVGDVKQSIYRFRLADPTIFIEKYQAFKGEKRQEDALVTLSKNFRSAAGVIDSVNTVFEKIMSPTLGEVAYDEQARLYKGLEAAGDYRKSEVYIIEKPPAAAEEDGDEISVVETEARFIAKKIQSQVGRPFFDTKRGEERRLEYRDVAVLMRAITGRGEIYAKIFSEQGIPAYYDGGGDYYESLEIGVVMNLLKLIDNRRQDLPLLSVMTSPVGNFTLEECTDIRLADRERPYYAAAEAYMTAQEDDLAQKLRAFYGKLDQWREASRVMDIESFLWQLYMDTGYYYFVGALPGGETRQNNLRLLLKRAGDYKASTLRGLFYFIQFVERMKKSGSDMGAPSILSDQENVVRIMTIHKSKGLEFPVVFLAGMGSHFNKQEGSGRIFFHKRLGICCSCIDLEKRALTETLQQKICTMQCNMEASSEEMRLLYVAMTRAQEAFIAVGSVKTRDLPRKYRLWQDGATPYQLKKAASLLDWLVIALEDGRSAVLSEQVSSVETESFRLQVLTQAEALAEETVLEEALREGEFPADPAIDAEVDRRLGFVYPKAGEAEAPGKITVTAFQTFGGKKQDDPQPVERLPRPAFMEEAASSWTAAQRGTAMHALLQHLDLGALRKALPQGEAAVSAFLAAQRDALVQKALLPQGLAQTIDLGAAKRFIESDLFDRLLAALKICREQPFYHRISAAELGLEAEDRVVVQGMLDCAFLEADGWVLLDYKTDHFRGPQEREKIVARYRQQIEFYARALAALTEIPVKEKYLCLVSAGVWIAV
ncbi:MAG: helicase-exonuclease AddAB subunit AddA [Eubacterium sp.]|nr:helicase-exonuclease AddAB subunit AddA [Eubacterium sp.]